jgi:hypothetical protein
MQSFKTLSQLLWRRVSRFSAVFFLCSRLRFCPPFFFFFAWWPPLLFLVRIFLCSRPSSGTEQVQTQPRDFAPSLNSRIRPVTCTVNPLTHAQRCAGKVIFRLKQESAAILQRLCCRKHFIAPFHISSSPSSVRWPCVCVLLLKLAAVLLHDHLTCLLSGLKSCIFINYRL